jgi:hypothetical protein
MLGDDVLKAEGKKQGHGDLGRVPVAVRASAPRWRPLAGGSAARRPVIALPDTGVEPHPWLAGAPGDPIVHHAHEPDWPQPGDLADSSNFRGHATFVAGVIRQVGPDCRILSARVMGNDGIVQSTDSLNVLKWLATQAESHRPDRFVDVVCVAYGTSDPDPSHLHDLRGVFGRLVQAGVLVVASAGNDGSGAPTYPAALAAEAPYSSAMVSVGATNPDGCYAHYSNWGPWVTHRTTGSGVISIMPPSFNGPSLSPPPPDPGFYPDTKGVTIDPDNFRDGFARWSGTSFSAAVIAGLLGQALAGDDGALGSADRVARALAAISPYRFPHEYGA